MIEPSRPRASILVLTWNSKEVAGDAVASALAQTVAPIEVIVVDNASTDGTPHVLGRRFGQSARIVVTERNVGYAGGYNRALDLANAPFVLLLNPDARLAPDFLERALPAFEDPRVGIVTGTLWREDGVTVDSSGLFLARSRKPLDRGFDRRHDASRDTAGPVLGACGAAALYRRAMIDDIADDGDLFDADYFAFYEDLEVSWRAWRAGWRAVHVPEARAVHLRAGGRKRGAAGLMFERETPVLAHIVKNRYLTMLRHDSLGALLVDLPFVAARELALVAALAVKRPAVFGLLWHERDVFERALAKRRADARRRGVWGAWSRRVPPRGAWRSLGAARP